MKGVGHDSVCVPDLIFVSLETGESCTLEQYVDEAKQVVDRVKSVVVSPSDDLYVIHWKTPTGHTGHGSPITMDTIRAVLNDKSLQFDSIYVDHDGTKHWFVKQE